MKNFEIFKSKMAYAKNMMAEDTEYSRYWVGYIRGLRRNYHGENFGTDEEHQRYLSFVDSEIPDRKRFGQGYSDGFREIL